ncbi:MAG: hypothetical protein AAF941_00895 [Pseudomonadota bacterium]
MGLLVHSLSVIPQAERELYVYLLDYGWPSDEFEKAMHDNFDQFAMRASETNSVVVGSRNGIHFANEVLSWHSICGHDATDLLPAILLTHTHPSYFTGGLSEPPDDMFQESTGELPGADIGDIALLPIRKFCTTPSDFLKTMATIFEDLEAGKVLQNFECAQFDVLRPVQPEPRGRVGKALLLQPNFYGIGIDLKKLFAPRETRETEKH